MQTINNVIINKLTLAQYKTAKASNLLNNSEVYVLSDIDEQLDNIITYKESLDVNNPIILRDLESGIYKIYGYFKYNTNQSGISGVDPFAYVIVEKGTSFSYATVISTNSSNRYKITDTTYEDLDDTGWIDVELTDNFKAYGNDTSNTPQYRKKNDIVYVRGIISPKTELAGSTTQITIFTLPSGYRPTKSIMKLCQGSVKNTWLLQVNPNGSVTFARYGTTSNATASTSVWLPFEISFPI